MNNLITLITNIILNNIVTLFQKKKKIKYYGKKQTRRGTP